MILSVREDNPYGRLGYVLGFSDKAMVLDRFRLKPSDNVSDIIHTIKENESLLDIAFDYYGSSRYWWVIRDINDIDVPFDLTPGNTLVIPDINAIKAILR